MTIKIIRTRFFTLLLLNSNIALLQFIEVSSRVFCYPTQKFKLSSVDDRIVLHTHVVYHTANVMIAMNMILKAAKA